MFIYNIFPQFRTLAGGERLSLKILEEVAKAGHRVEVVTLSMEKSCCSILPTNIKLIEISSWMNRIKNHYIKVFIEHLFIYRTIRYIPKDVDIVIFHKSSSVPALYYFKKIMKSSVPAIYFSFEPPRFAYDLQKETLSKLGPLGIVVWLFLPIFRYLDKKFAIAGNEIFTYSIFMKNWLEVIYKTKIRNIVPLGINPEDFTNLNPIQVRQKYGISNKEKIIITSNKLHHRKRVHLLIQAMEYVKDEVPEVKALILGTGPEEKTLKSLAKKLKLENMIIFCGHIGNEIPHYYASADIYVHPGKNEPFGLSVIEAQMAGIAVVSVREGEPLKTVLEDKTGIFCDAEPKDMADKIIKLLKDNNLRKRLAKNTREHIKNNYTWQISAQKFTELCKRYESKNL